ncbi:hypothetical protein [Thauera humireducens]|uniref:hypothetical protein n=1 Tax=Thauera humireducens TaxID=1134435 RepID=UPI00311EEAEB
MADVKLVLIGAPIQMFELVDRCEGLSPVPAMVWRQRRCIARTDTVTAASSTTGIKAPSTEQRWP